jgi:hypothetical protein
MSDYKKKNWRDILIIWIAMGVLATGLFQIFPYYEYFRGNYEANYIGRDISILITIVGAILIWGLKIYKKDLK